MVCFSAYRRRFLPVAVVLVLSFMTGCNYHGRLKRGFYKTPDFDDKIQARVMVAADKFIQHSFSFNDGNLTPVNSFQIRTDDGAAVAAADALGTLFSEVEVNLYKYRSQYDYVAELDYRVQEDSEYFSTLEESDGFLWLKKYRVPKFRTTVLLTLRNPKTRQSVIQLSAGTTSNLKFNNAALGAYWFNRATLTLLFPLIAPVYVSSAGDSIRETLEQDLRTCLRQIMREMEENRIVFAPGVSASFARNDARYRELLEKTVYIETPHGHGSGFFISQDGYLITNAHVVESFRDVRFYLYEDYPFEPQTAEAPFRYARVVKVNTARDLALLKAEGKYPYFELETDRSQYQTGAAVVALGNPRNEFWSVTEGIISALKNDNGIDTIQTDTAYTHGSSGGPLVLRSSGKVIGVTHKGIRSDKAFGINFAITAFEVKRTLGITFPIDEESLLRQELERLPLKPQKAGNLPQVRKNYVK